MPNIHQLSTAAVPPIERLSFWNDACIGAFGAVVVEAEPENFQGILTTLCAGSLNIVSIKSTAAVCRSDVMWEKAGRDDMAFCLQVVQSGRCRIWHAGSEIVCLPGDMVIANRSRSYELAATEPFQGLVLWPPWPRFAAYTARLQLLAGNSINVMQGPDAVLSHFIRSAWAHLVADDDAEWPQSATDVIWDLFEALLKGEAVRAASPALAGNLRQARALADARVGDCGFKRTEMAAALGVSPPYLQKVFAEVGTTPSRFLVARRLETAAAHLRCVDSPRSITDIATECGFHDLSCFSRAFRRRFGMSARAYRGTFGVKAADWR